MPLSLIEQSDLQSAVTLSLFSNRGEYWGDALTKKPTGSTLFQLKREPLGEPTLKLAEDYASESIQWLVEKGLAKNFRVKASFKFSQLRIAIAIDGVNFNYVV